MVRIRGCGVHGKPCCGDVRAVQTRRAVKADTDFLTQAARQVSVAEAQAALTSKIFAASDRPALTLPEGQSVFIEDSGPGLRVDTVVLNYGTGAATFDQTLDDPRLKFYWVGTYDVFAKPERIVIMNDSNARISFVADKSKVITSVPAASPTERLPEACLMSGTPIFRGPTSIVPCSHLT